jgi:hypothetical protein
LINYSQISKPKSYKNYSKNNKQTLTRLDLLVKRDRHYNQKCYHCKVVIMSLTEILSALHKLAPDDKLKAIKFLTTELSNVEKLPTEDLESQAWLEADLVDNLPEYDWGESEIPKGQPVEYLSGLGLAIKER